MNQSFKDLIDVDALEKMVTANYEATGMPVGIVDALSGEVCAGAGWQKICTHFHRKHPESNARCIESDTKITGEISNGNSLAYKCKNGLWDIGIPVMCENRHIATIFLGQFFYEDEKIDLEKFKNQARKYGFPLSDYLSALKEVPAFTKEKVDCILKYNQSFAEFISGLVTKKVQYEREHLQRKEAESMHADLFHNMMVGVIYYDASGAITDANLAAQNIMGYTLAQMRRFYPAEERWKSIRLNGAPFPPEEYPDRVVLQTGREVYDEIMGVFNPLKKEYRWVSVHSTPRFRSGEMRPYQVFSTFHDITERILIEERLKKLNENLEQQVDYRTRKHAETIQELETLFNNTQVGIMVLKNGRVFERGNQRLADIFGYASPLEMKGLSMKALHLSENHFKDFGEKYYYRLCSKEMMQIEYELKRRDGIPVWCVLSGKALDSETPPDLEKGVIWVVDDISRRKRSEQILKEKEAKFRRLFHAAAVPMCYVSEKGVILDINTKFTQLFGYTSKDIPALDEWWSAAYPDPEYRQWVVDTWQSAVDRAKKEDREIKSEEYRVTCKNGSIKHVIISGTTFEDYFLATFVDITERKKAEEDLDRSNKELEQFAYVASHDLQEPLRAVVGFLQLLQSRYGDQLDDKGRHYIERSVRGGHRMQTLIMDLLSLSRVNTQTLRLKQTDLTEIIKAIVENIETVISEKNAAVSYETLPVMSVDANQIQSLFQNLILNALKYNKSVKPSVEIGCRKENQVYTFYVKDNGIGIPASFYQRIFSIFQRLHTRDEYSGTGIGLSLCKRIVERHGGTIWVESEPEKGSIFYFNLPAQG